MSPDTLGVTVRVPAKVNLGLGVGARRADGFHELCTVYHAVGLYDEVTVFPSDEWSCEVVGSRTDGVPADASNLAVRAGMALARRLRLDQECHVRISKDIPVAGGMAGGSADAAATLLACDALWGADTPKATLEKVAAGLGSDIPFLLTGHTALGTGRGEHVTTVLTQGKFHWVLAPNAEGLSTPAVYAEFDRLNEGRDVPRPVPSQQLLTALRAGDAQALGQALYNDLQEAALSLRPDLRETLDAGLDMGAIGALVSGSGPTIAFLVPDSQTGLEVSIGLTAQGLVPEVKRAVGPVAGATVVTPSGHPAGSHHP